MGNWIGVLKKVGGGREERKEGSRGKGGRKGEKSLTLFVVAQLRLQFLDFDVLLGEVVPGVLLHLEFVHQFFVHHLKRRKTIIESNTQIER